MRRLLLAMLGLGLWAAAGTARAEAVADAPDAATGPAAEVIISDLSDRFLDFYQRASQPGVDEAERWRLWRTHYGFTALPAGPELEARTREALARAWPGYPAAMDRILAGADGMRPPPERLLRQVADTLALDRPLRLHLLAYVGFNDGGGFTRISAGRITVALPLEDEPARRAITAAHELTHAVHHPLGSTTPDTPPLAQLLFSEGLAIHVSQTVVPGGQPERYLEARAGWFRQARAREAAILRGVRAHLAESSAAQWQRFDTGPGPAGLDREGWYAGWRVVGALLDQGWTLDQVARIPHWAMAREAARVIDGLLAPPRPR